VNDIPKNILEMAWTEVLPTSVTLEEAQELPVAGDRRFNAYACLDTTGTLEVFEVLRPRLDADQLRMYKWSLAQSSPALAMTLRGCRIDVPLKEERRKLVTKEVEAACRDLQTYEVVTAIWDGEELETGKCEKGERLELESGLCTDGKRHSWPKNWKADFDTVCKKCGTRRRTLTVGEAADKHHTWPRAARGAPPLDPRKMRCVLCGIARTKPKPYEPTSPVQTKHLLFDLLKAPEQHNKDGNLSTGKEALERIAIRKPKLMDLCYKLLNFRDLDKQKQFLECRLSPVGRFHASFNVATPWTGRWSSSKDPFGQGSNMQNIAERHRAIFLADPGKELFYADLKTAESMLVAYMSGDEAYIEAHKGDVHTFVCRKLWPDLAWTGDIKKDKAIAASTNPPWDLAPGHDLRFQAKRVQHGSNYGLSPRGLGFLARIPLKHAEAAQAAYFEAFPRILEGQAHIIQRVSDSLNIYTALRRVVRLFGRPWDSATHKQGLAFGPQGGVGDILDIGLWRLWDRYDPAVLELLAQVHDAVLGQSDPAERDFVTHALKEAMTVKVPVEDIRGTWRECVIPVEVAFGTNWGKFNDNPKKGALNLLGLREVA